MSEQRNQQSSEQPSPIVVLAAGYDSSVYERGLIAFARDLPELLTTHYGHWVIYHGDDRFGPAETFQELDSACQEKRIPIGEQVVRMIEPEVEPEISF
jgi:hypothetical protein